jgi:ribosomal protein S18 acetylase RimI-like enzyme
MQGKGLGTYLIDLVEKETKKHKLRKIRLKVFKDNPAKKLYLRLGYKLIKSEKSDIILEKKLKV